jgi:dolichol-phosphate mannosyltransferase
MKLSLTFARRAHVRRYGLFCVVGASGLVVDMTILWLLASPEMLGWDHSVSKAMAAEAALVNNFAWNEGWTFRGGARRGVSWDSRVRRFLKFNLICLTGIGLSVALLDLQVTALHVGLLQANLTAIAVVSLWNYGLNAKLTWRSGSVGEESPGEGAASS